MPLDVTFHDSSTADPRYPLVEWRWEFGDGAFSVESTDDPVTHTYTQIGEYDAYLIVTNSLGCIDTSYSVRIKVGDKINLDFSVSKTVLCIGDTVQFTDITSDILKDSIMPGITILNRTAHLAVSRRKIRSGHSNQNLVFMA